MNDVRSCSLFIDAILDDGVPRPDGLASHLAACPACRALEAAQRGARGLAHPALELPPPVPEHEVRARVRRRRTGRRVAAGVGAAAFAALLVFLKPVGPSGPPPTRGDLFALADGVAELTHRDPLADDPALGGLGAVADWLAPPPARSIGFDSIVPPPHPRAAAGGDAP